MTVNTLTTTSGPYTGNGVTTTFAYTFRIEDKNQLTVYQKSVAGVISIMTVDTDYTVAGIGVDGGGNITRVGGALPTGVQWFIESNYIATQATDFQSQGAFFPEVHEKALDKITFLIQQLQESLKYTVKGTSFDGGVGEIPSISDRAGKFLSFDENGDPVASNFVTVDPATIVDTHADIRNLSKLLVQNAFARGGASLGDGQGGYYFYDDTDTSSAESPPQVIVANDNARWKQALFNSVTVPTATETTQGKVELATQAELDSGTDTTRAITPSTVHNVFTARLDGFGKDGFHKINPVGNLNNVLWNSVYRIDTGSFNFPADLVNYAFLHTYVNTSGSDNATQMLYGVIGADKHKIWMRHRQAAVWEAWVKVIDGAPAVLTPATLSSGVNGYYKDEDNGWIHQWGTATPATNGATITFPIAFPNACRNVVVSQSQNLQKDANPFSSVYTATSFFGGYRGSSDQINWQAIGF